MAKEEISIKGLDSLSRTFLGANTSKDHVTVNPGQQAKPEALARYNDELKKAFISRAGGFTEDLVAFIVQQKRVRELTDAETVFALALANINLRLSYATAQEGEQAFSEDDSNKLLLQFDELCFAAQEYYDANA